MKASIFSLKNKPVKFKPLIKRNDEAFQKEIKELENYILYRFNTDKKEAGE